MILVDANLLLHAYNPRSREHDTARSWLESTLAGPSPVGLAWLTVWAFLRITTHPRVFERPFAVADAHEIVGSWLVQPCISVLDPGERHFEILHDLAIRGQALGPLLMDAVIAAIAIEHGATLQTTDRDFARFPGLRWRNPLQQ